MSFFAKENIKTLLLRPVHNAPLSHLLLGLAAVFLSFQTVRVHGTTPSVLPVQFVIFIFCSTLFQYALHALGGRVFTLFRPNAFAGLSRQGKLLGGVAIAVFPVGIGCFFLLGVRQMLYAVILAAVSLAYSFPVLPFGGLRRFKNHFVIKIIVLSAVWTLATVLIPAAYLANPDIKILLWLAAFRFTYFVAICIPFEIRDREWDRALGISSRWLETEDDGKLYRASYICFGVCAALLPVGIILGISGPVATGFITSIGLGAWLVHLASQNPRMALFYFLLDSSLIFQSLLIVIGKHLE